jgi:hypothetical protein
MVPPEIYALDLHIGIYARKTLWWLFLGVLGKNFKIARYF